MIAQTTHQIGDVEAPKQGACPSEPIPFLKAFSKLNTWF